MSDTQYYMIIAAWLVGILMNVVMVTDLVRRIDKLIEKRTPPVKA